MIFVRTSFAEICGDSNFPLQNDKQVLQRFAETTNPHKTVQKKLKMLAREIPLLEHSSHPPRPTWVAVKPIMFTPSFAQSVRKKCLIGYFASRISNSWKIGSQSEEQDSRAGLSEKQCFQSFRHGDRTKWRSMGDFDSQDFDTASTSFDGVIARTLRDWQR